MAVAPERDGRDPPEFAEIEPVVTVDDSAAASAEPPTPTPTPTPTLRILALNWRDLHHPQAGGSEVNLFEQAERWVEAGHSVTVVCADPGRALAPARHGDENGIHFHRMGSRVSLYPLAALFLLRNAWRYDVVLDVANGIPFFAPLFTSQPVVLMVHHVHDGQWRDEFPRPIAEIGRFLELRAVPWVYRACSVIAVSPTTREALIVLGIDPTHIGVVFNGVDFIRPMPRHRFAGPRVAFIGRLKHYKRIDHLIKAVSELRGRVRSVHLDIVGEGDARPEIERMIKREGLTDVVSLHGKVSEEEKNDILDAATVFAQPSAHEGWGLSVIEANARGVPAVAYDVPGLSDAIRNGETGLLAHDDADFREKIGAVLTDTRLRNRLGAAARRWASRFTWLATARGTLQVLQASIARLGSRVRPRRGEAA
jgi:glycosyltransferase involved in cell wall biosynthesis